ncbi:uncharacterized protein LOC110037077 [Phalaenopsis equestris]|uniref:uncharacterized protein LOC110037077 n=1 Tax=Phalaenopsis equestris TaxID=78828 RepID=UPI0009E245F2|nr:uncharacterized protein LOC110037077 [Phalaenopsis equestris]
MNRIYSFKDEAVSKMFRSLMKKPEFKLPEPRKPEDADKKDQPNYCPYHRLIGHTIEGCFSFKDWLERNLKEGNITIPKEYLKEPEKGSINMISVEPIAPVDPYANENGWKTAWSRSSKKILDQIQIASAQASDERVSGNDGEIDNTGYNSSGSEEPVLKCQGAPVAINLDFSDLESTPEESITTLQEDEITEVYLRRGKVLPSGTSLMEKKKGNKQLLQTSHLHDGRDTGSRGNWKSK